MDKLKDWMYSDRYQPETWRNGYPYPKRTEVLSSPLSILVSKFISRSTKIRVYKTVTRQILMYGREAWVLTLKEENKILVAKRKTFRTILGATKEKNGAWRIRKSLKIDDLVNEADIMGETKCTRLRCHSYVASVEWVKIVQSNIYFGRPRYCWIEQIYKDLYVLQIASWRQATQNSDSRLAHISVGGQVPIRVAEPAKVSL